MTDSARHADVIVVGAGHNDALIGLAVGHSIDWPVTDGSQHRLRIIAVER